MTIVTNSQLKDFRRCRRRWWLAWYRKLALPESFIGNRATGLRVHRALEAYYVPEGQVPVDPRDALERILVEDWTALSQRANARMDEAQVTELSDQFQKAAGLERAMIEGYIQWLEETGADANLEVVASEAVLTKDIEIDHHPVTIAGLIDARVRRISDNVRLLIDHKTVDNFKTPQATLPLNTQMLHYHLLEWLNTPDGETRCDGALYNMLRRVKRTVRANPPFYDRVEIRHNQLELESYRRHLTATARGIIYTTEALDAGMEHHDIVPPNPTMDCSWDCDFFAVCGMFNDGSRAEDALTNLYQQTDPYDRYDHVVLEGQR